MNSDLLRTAVRMEWSLSALPDSQPWPLPGNEERLFLPRTVRLRGAWQSVPACTLPTEGARAPALPSRGRSVSRVTQAMLAEGVPHGRLAAAPTVTQAVRGCDLLASPSHRPAWSLRSAVRWHSCPRPERRVGSSGLLGLQPAVTAPGQCLLLGLELGSGRLPSDWRPLTHPPAERARTKSGKQET